MAVPGRKAWSPPTSPNFFSGGLSFRLTRFSGCSRYCQSGQRGFTGVLLPNIARHRNAGISRRRFLRRTDLWSDYNPDGETLNS